MYPPVASERRLALGFRPDPGGCAGGRVQRRERRLAATGWETEQVCRVAQGAFGRAALIAIPGPMAPHVHHHSHVLFKAWGPSVGCTVDGRTLRLGSDSAILVNPWACHHLGAPGDRWPVVILALYIEPGWIEAQMPGPSLGGASMFGRDQAPLTPRLARRKAALLAHLAANPAAIDGTATEADAVDALIADILETLLTDHAACRVSAGPNADRGAADQPIRKAIDLISDCHGNVPEMGLIAREVGLSRPRFFARFRATTGTSPTLFANHCRLERAASSLQRPDVSLVDLSLGLGFSDQSSFTRFFRNHFGVPPGTFRRGLGGRSGAPV